MRHNIITNVDSYKISMERQYPDNTQYVYSYVESRGGVEDELVFFGLQYFIKEYLSKPITKAELDMAYAIAEARGDVLNYDGWLKIIEKYKGFLPLSIKALPEGTVVGNRVVMAVVVNTDPEFFWLTTWLETSLLRAIWYPTSVASNSRDIKKIIKSELEKSGDISGLPFKLHDFGARGAQTFESACLGGTAHLINFLGSDTTSATEFAMDYYGANVDDFSFSVLATEHSISTAYGPDHEADYVSNHIDKSLEKGRKIFSAVADTYNIYNFVEMLGTTLKDKIVSLGDVGATLVVRPDSGDATVIPVEVIKFLMDKFGYTVNEKGYKVLPSYLRVIQGDGIEKETIIKIYENMEKDKLSSDNIVFGMGGKLLGAPQRDDFSFAMKASDIVIDSVHHAIAKNPITDVGKKAKKGRFKTYKDIDGVYKTALETDDFFNDVEDVMVEYYRNGEIFCDQRNSEIRERAAL